MIDFAKIFTSFLCAATTLLLIGCVPTTAAPLPTVTRPSGVLNLAIPTKVVTAVPTATTPSTPPPTQTPAPTQPAEAIQQLPIPTASPTPADDVPVEISVYPTIPADLSIPVETFTETVRVPILMYHYVSDPPAGADEYRVDLSVTPDNFREQMRYLAENNYNTIDFYDLMLVLNRQKPLPPKPVILTFDDGYIDNYQYAFPILEEFGLKGTFFIITEFVDFENPNHMSWEMIKEMAAAGHRIESHTKTHPNLAEQDWDSQLYQLLGSQETLAAHLGYTPRFFCYPGGRYNDETIMLLEELGYWGAVTTRSGKEHNFSNRYEWTRLRVRNNTYLPEFISLVQPPEGPTG